MPHPVNRRTFLRSTAIAMALPSLESMARASDTSATASPFRLVAIGTPFGFNPSAFVPTAAGSDFSLSPHLAHIKDHRADFTIVSGLSHPNTAGATHRGEAVMLTGAPYPSLSHNLQNTISLDQEFASHNRGQTRYNSLVLTTVPHGISISVTGNGVAIPAISRPSEIFAMLFLSGSKQQAEEELHRIGQGRSMLDTVGDQAKRLGRKVGAVDRARLDEYYSSVRDVENQLRMSSEWVNRPKPPAPGRAPTDLPSREDTLSPTEQAKKLQLMFDMIHLALATDSTRAVTIKTFGTHHSLSHHGKQPEKMAECLQFEVGLLQAVGSLLAKLKESRESEGRLLDRTMVLLTSNLRDGNSHWTHDLPVFLAGGGFKHGRHLTFNPALLKSLADSTGKAAKATPNMGVNQAPLCNLYLSLLQRAGIPTDRFGSSTGTLTGL
ncbi:DUF1552 domain-containing protein [Lignipirellula cremea]|uniref:DUF1552 domain-containing protein n=1 Tax=Lignipirellula cremea TaxID=2528010 RepID=A0A518DKN0_9BACT|nr:DUF1552 domain-containing protein [Lignipirellula cremea]QDU92394.1 hypothetical protein Pla8534_01410 [Lignipirellula cremea]